MTNFSNEKKGILQWITENQHDFFEVSDFIWENPELSMEEFVSTEKLKGLLKNQGFSIDSNVSGMPTAFVAAWGEGKPVLGFNCECDALPGLSQKNECSHPEAVNAGFPGHGCGHNLIAVSGIMAASALKAASIKNDLSCTIKVFGGPAEELQIGKPFMARDGVFDGVDAFIDWHPWAGCNTSGPFVNNGYFNVKYHFKGKSSHGYAPWHGKSSLDAAILTTNAIEMLREHLKPGTDQSATTINYAFPDVGNAFPNVVPDKSTLWCVGRGNNIDLLKEMMHRLDKCAEGAAVCTGTTVETEYITASHMFVPNYTLAQAMHENFKAIGVPDYSGEERQWVRDMQDSIDFKHVDYPNEVDDFGLFTMGPTDTAVFSWFAPQALCLNSLLPTMDMGWHNWLVTRAAGCSIGKKALINAVEIMSATAYDLLINPQLVKTAQEELQSRLNGKSFETLLPKELNPCLTINRDLMSKFRTAPLIVTNE